MVELLVADGGAEPTLIVRKHIADSAEFVSEVRWLTRAHGPGVVRLHAVETSANRYATYFAGRCPLGAFATGPARAAPVVTAAWSVLERLHRLGLNHGSVTADHVIVSGGGPVLISPCGSRPTDRHTDISGFGSMIADLAAVWRFDADVGEADVEKWTEVGRGVEALGEVASSDDRLVSGAEVRRLLGDLEPAARPRRRRVRRTGVQEAATV